MWCCRSELQPLPADLTGQTAPLPLPLPVPGLLLYPAAAIGAVWLWSRRARYRTRSRPLSLNERAALSDYFSPALLDTARIAARERIRNPPLPRALRRSALPGMLDLSTVSGMAFIDTIVIARNIARDDGARGRSASTVPPSDHSLLFHELVHVAQYRVLGVRPFVREYLRGWLSGGRDYFSIPLEKQAFDLQRRFDHDRAAPFSVESEIRRAFGEN
jgi:hypothetical protein